MVIKASDSACGPDNMPYSAYKLDVSLTVALLHVFIKEMLTDDFVFADWIVSAFMVFLPTKSFAVSPAGLKIYYASSVRPLSLSNTFPKLVACALKFTLCEIVDSKSSHTQKCITGRSMVDNVILLASAMHEFAIGDSSSPCAVFFDFRIAFPSVSHAYLWLVLEAIGLPILLALVDEIQKVSPRHRTTRASKIK